MLFTFVLASAAVAACVDRIWTQARELGPNQREVFTAGIRPRTYSAILAAATIALVIIGLTSARMIPLWAGIPVAVALATICAELRRTSLIGRYRTAADD